MQKTQFTSPAPIHDKNSQQRKNKRKLLQSDKGSTATIIFIGERLNAFPLRIVTRQRILFSLLQNISGVEHYNQCRKARERNEKHID